MGMEEFIKEMKKDELGEKLREKEKAGEMAEADKLRHEIAKIETSKDERGNINVLDLFWATLRSPIFWIIIGGILGYLQYMSIKSTL